MTVVVIGELNVDLIVSGTDIVPEWNREKLVDSFKTALGSSSAITACMLAGLGQDVRFVSVVGDDDYGRFCMRRLQERGVNTEPVQVRDDVQTGVTLSFSTPSDRGLVTYMGSISALTPSDIPESVYDEADHIHFGSFYLQEGMRDHWAALFAKARSRGVSTSFDTGWDIRNDWRRPHIDALLKHTDLFMPSEEEILRIYAAETLDEVWAALPAERHWVLVKRGSKGSVLVSPEGERLEAPPYKVDPLDTTGAGDSFNAGAIHAFKSGLTGEAWLRFANACGAWSTQHIGGAETVPTLRDIADFQASRA